MPNRLLHRTLLLTQVTVLSALAFGTACVSIYAQQQGQISSNERELVEAMLSNVHYVLKANYYDPSFHGIEIDARYKTYLEQVKKAPTLAAADGVVEAYLAGLDDSHTVFIPPENSNRISYGFRMRMIGDGCFITEVRPGTDAGKKLHPGDQVLSVNGYSVNRKSLWQLSYYFDLISPKKMTEFGLRDTSGNTRRVGVITDFEVGQSFKFMGLQHGHGDTDDFHAKLKKEERQRELRSRFSEDGEALFWKLPTFSGDEGDMSRVLGLARKHRALVLDLRGNPERAAITGLAMNYTTDVVGGVSTYGLTGGDSAPVAVVSRSTVAVMPSNNPEVTAVQLSAVPDAVRFMLGSLFDHDVTIGKEVRRKGEKTLVAKSHGNDIFTGQLTVLVDSRSSSAAEVFARVIQIEHRGSVLGDRSAGSVMEGSYFPLKEGTNVVLSYGAMITTADLIMSDGQRLEKVGVTPDIVFLPTAADLAAGRDPVLARAAELSGVKLDPETVGKMFPFVWSPN